MQRKTSSGAGLYYIHTDLLSSIERITNATGQLVSEYTYTPWGGRVLLSGVNITDRGYTGHEHLSPFGDDSNGGFCLINMNGRIYDPVLARFLSPDPYVQAPDFTQSFNRYAYGWNNPFKYTDPSGEFVFTALIPGAGIFIDAALWGAVIGGAGYTASVAFSYGGFNSWDWGQFGKAVGIGAISGVATAGIGQVFGAVGSNGIMGEIARAYTHGYANGIISEFTGGDFMQGFASGALGSLGGSAFMMYGGSLANSPIGTYAFSSLAGGVGAELTGGEFWQGAAIGLMNAGLNHLQQVTKRPAFKDLLANFPMNENGGELPGSDVYELIGGKVLSEHLRDPEAYNNACALRVSSALNGSGVDLPNIPGKTLSGADGKNYFYRARDLYNWMSQSYGKPTTTNDYSSLSGKRGVYIMQANFPARFGAWGHATLYNMTGTIGNSYAVSHAYRYNLWGF